MCHLIVFKTSKKNKKPNKTKQTKQQKATPSMFYSWFGISVNKEEEGNVLFNDALNTFPLWLYGVEHIVEDTSCQHYMGYSFWLAASDFLYASSQRQVNT